MKQRIVILAGAAGLLAGCATPYQNGLGQFTGGHIYRRASEDTFVISFRGNGFTSPKRAVDFANLRAAEVTLEHGFRYFSILGQGDRSQTDFVQGSTVSSTSGSVSPYGGFSATTVSTPTTMPIHKPGADLHIRCYDKQPSGHVGLVYNAAEVRERLRAEYKLR
jgi:hypothetical protein